MHFAIEREPLRGIWRGAMHFAIERKPLRGIWRGVMQLLLNENPYGVLIYTSIITPSGFSLNNQPS